MPKIKKGVLIRKVNQEECPWLEQDLPVGKQVFEFTGYTYGCISDDGIAVSDKPNTHPFFEVPPDAVSWE